MQANWSRFSVISSINLTVKSSNQFIYSYLRIPGRFFIESILSSSSSNRNISFIVRIHCPKNNFQELFHLLFNVSMEFDFIKRPFYWMDQKGFAASSTKSHTQTFSYHMKIKENKRKIKNANFWLFFMVFLYFFIFIFIVIILIIKFLNNITLFLCVCVMCIVCVDECCWFGVCVLFTFCFT